MVPSLQLMEKILKKVPLRGEIFSFVMNDILLLMQLKTFFYFFSLFHSGKLLVEGHSKIAEMLKTRQYAYVESKLTHQKFISDEFSIDGVCNFYLCKHSITSNFALAFPVGLCNIKWSNLFCS